MTTLIVLYGLPAVGKLTVARRVAERTGYRLFHNHLTVDLALSLFDFGTPGFRDLRAAVWREAFDAALEGEVEGMVFTFNPEPSVDRDFIPSLIRRVAERDGRVLLVELTAPDEVLHQRIDAESRRGTGKLTNPVLFADLMAKGVFSTRDMPTADLVLDTSRLAPDIVADRIVESLS